MTTIKDYFFNETLPMYINNLATNGIKHYIKEMIKKINRYYSLNGGLENDYSCYIVEVGTTHFFEGKIKIQKFFSGEIMNKNMIRFEEDIKITLEDEEHAYDLSQTFNIFSQLIKPKITYGANGIKKMTLTPTKLNELCEFIECSCQFMSLPLRNYFSRFEDDKQICEFFIDSIEPNYKMGFKSTTEKQCDICMKVENNFCRLECSHELCMGCAREIYKNNTEKPCPFCRNEQVIMFSKDGDYVVFKN